MTRPLADSVFETTQTAGTGTIVLEGASTGYRRFRAAFATDTVVAYVIQQATYNGDVLASLAREVGLGTLTRGIEDTLSRDVVLTQHGGASSGGKLDIAAGGADVFCATPAALTLIGARSVSAAVALSAADIGTTILCTAGAGGFSVTLPPGSSLPPGAEVTVSKVDAADGTITVAGDGGAEVAGTASRVIERQWQSERYVWTGAAWLVLGGGLSESEVDARADARARDVVLASDVDLAAGVRKAVALSASMDEFRWLVIVAGRDSADYSTHVRVISANLTAATVSGAAELLAWVLGNNHATLLVIDALTGLVTERGSESVIPGFAETGGTAWDGANLFGWLIREPADTAQLFVLDRSDGARTARGTAQSLGAGTHTAGDLTWTGADLLGWVVNNADDTAQLYAIDRDNGELTARGTSQSPNSGNLEAAGIAWTGAALLGWVVNNAGDTAQLYEIHPDNGALTARGPARALGAGDWSAAGIAWTGVHLLGWVFNDTGDTAQLYEIDPDNGALTTRGSAQDPGTSNERGLSLAWGSAESGVSVAGGIFLDKAADVTLGMLSRSNARVQQIIGVR